MGARIVQPSYCSLAVFFYVLSVVVVKLTVECSLSRWMSPDLGCLFLVLVFRCLRHRVDEYRQSRRVETFANPNMPEADYGIGGL